MILIRSQVKNAGTSYRPRLYESCIYRVGPHLVATIRWLTQPNQGVVG